LRVRLHGIFGSHTNTSANAGLSNEIVPFNPKQVILEVFGAPGAVATINYLPALPLLWTNSCRRGSGDAVLSERRAHRL
jgi:hypothetical protein